MATRTRDALEERLRQISSAREVRRMSRLLARAPESASLADEATLERLVSSAQLRELATREYEQPVVSLYLNLEPEEAVVGKPRAHFSVFNSLRHSELAARRELVEALPAHARNALQADLDAIEAFLADLEPDGARSLAILKSGKQLNRVIRLPLRTADRLTIDRDPYLEPLEATIEENPAALVVEVEKEIARFWSHHLGRLQEIDSLVSFVPTDTVDSGRPGKVQRHRQTHLVWHLKASAQLTSRLLTDKHFGLLMLSGERTILAEFESFLPKAVQMRIVARLKEFSERERQELETEVERALAEHRRAQEEAALADLGEYRAAGVLICGLPGVIEAISLFQARRLFVTSRLEQPGYVCRQHHYLSLEPGRCPFCDAELLAVENVVDELIEVARMHGVELMLVHEAPELLDACGGVAAVIYASYAASKATLDLT
jgi:hypothetical protein